MFKEYLRKQSCYSFNSQNMYGSKIEINFKKKNTFNTTFGGIITFIIFCFFGLGVWFFGQELVYKKNPSVITQQRSVRSPKRIDDQLTSQPFVDPTIFSVKSYQETLTPFTDPQTGQKRKKTIQQYKKIKICDLNDVEESLQSYFGELDLPNLYCYANQEVFMEGDFDAENFSQLFFYVEKCKNSTDSQIICKTPEEINEKLRLTKLQVYLSDTIVDPLNYLNPFEKKGINLYSPTSSTLPKDLQFYFTNQYIESDIGTLYSQIEYKQTYIFADMKETTFFSDNNVLVRLLFRLQKQKENLMQRRYIKLADVVAQIGGLLKILITFGSLIVYPFSKLYLNKAIIDEVFNFNTEDKNEINERPQNQKMKQKLSKLNIQQNPQRVRVKSKFSSNDQNPNNLVQDEKDQQSQTQQNFNISSIKQSQQTLNDFQLFNFDKNIKQLQEAYKKLFTIPKNIINFKFFDILSHIYFKKWRQKQEKHVVIEKDVLSILSKLHEIDKLKSILLNQDQLKLFEYIPKPVISLKNEQTFDSTEKQQLQEKTPQSIVNPLNIRKIYKFLDGEKTEEEKATDAYDSLVNIMKKQKKNKIDEILINLIDPLILQNILNKEDKTQTFDSIFERSGIEFQNDDNQKLVIDEKIETQKDKIDFYKSQIIESSTLLQQDIKQNSKLQLLKVKSDSQEQQQSGNQMNLQNQENTTRNSVQKQENENEDDFNDMYFDEQSQRLKPVLSFPSDALLLIKQQHKLSPKKQLLFYQLLTILNLILFKNRVNHVEEQTNQLQEH